jgi:hypothetical protein
MGHFSLEYREWNKKQLTERNRLEETNELGYIDTSFLH